MRKMYDSTTAADCPTDGHLVAGYVDGSYKWRDSDWALFPHAVHVRIAVSAQTDDGHVLDVEEGAATPADVPAWLTMRRAAGIDPSVYVNLANAGSVNAACLDMGVALPHFWLAHYDNDPTIPAGYVAKQYADAAQTGGHYDASVVLDFWPGVDVAIEFVTKADFEAYKVALQAQLDEVYLRKDAPVQVHTHRASIAGTVTISEPQA